MAKDTRWFIAAASHYLLLAAHVCLSFFLRVLSVVRVVVVCLFRCMHMNV